MKAEIEDHWILLRGLGREARHWGDFPAVLRQEVENLSGAQARVDCLDLPGSGRFSEMKCPLTVEAITEFTRGKLTEVRRRLRADGQSTKRTWIVALSLGGMVASQWIHGWPRDFDGCVLINTSFRGFSPLFQRLRPEAWWRLLWILRNYKSAFECEKNVLRMVSNRPERFEEIARDWAAIADHRPISPENFLRQLTAAACFQASKEAPEIPLLVLNSVNDHMVNASCSVEIARRWHAELRRHPTAGHDLPLDEPLWVAREIAGWSRNLRK